MAGSVISVPETDSVPLPNFGASKADEGLPGFVLSTLSSHVRTGVEGARPKATAQMRGRRLRARSASRARREGQHPCIVSSEVAARHAEGAV